MGSVPPKTNPAVVIPEPPRPCLPVFKLAPVVQLVQSYSKFLLLAEVPPTILAAVCNPKPIPYEKDVGIAVTAVHAEPLYSSTVSLLVGGEPEAPPAATAAVVVPAPIIAYLPLFKFPPFVQEEPLYASVASSAGTLGVSPPKVKAAVCGPHAAL